MALLPLQPDHASADFLPRSATGRAGKNLPGLAGPAQNFQSTFYKGMYMLHEALRLIRLFHDISQTELARRIGVSKSYLSEIETGKKQPTLALLQQYSTEFKLPISSIMFFSESLEDNSFSERTRLKVSQKVIALLNFIAERSGKVTSE